MNELPEEPSARKPAVGGTPMEGEGYYGAHCQPQQKAADYGIPLLRRAIEAMQPPPVGAPFLIADYGCAQGHSSLAPVNAAIDAVRSHWGANVPVVVAHTDLPDNDFSTLFRLLSESPHSYLRGSRGVYAYAAGVGFYDPSFPPNTVGLGWTATTLHWLRRAPCPLPGQIFSSRAIGEVRAAWARQASEDWQRFLSLRARELCPGGRLVIVASPADEQGLTGAEGLLDMANDSIRDLVTRGELQQDEYERMALPIFYRKPAEWAAPFRPAFTGPAEERLELEEPTMAPFYDLFWARFQEDGDIRAFAAAEASFLRAFTAPHFFNALDARRTPDTKQDLMESIFRGVAERAAADPEAAACNWQLYLFTIARTA